MKKLLLLSALLLFACSSDSEGNPCVYEPTLTTEAATDITETSATLNGVISIVSENCDVPNNAEQGFVYSTEIQPTLEDIQVNVNGANISTTIDGLTPNTNYYVRSFMTNNFGDFYGDEVSFITVAGQVVLNTLEVTGVTENLAISGGQIVSNGNTTILSKGVCWSVNQNSTTEDNFINNEDDTTSFQCLIEDLSPNTQYYVRAFASNEFGTYYGNEITITTLCEFDFDDDGICDSDDNDDDNDGVDDSEDCEPFDASIYPGANEISDGIDNNCDGQVDENLTGNWEIVFNASLEGLNLGAFDVRNESEIYFNGWYDGQNNSNQRSMFKYNPSTNELELYSAGVTAQDIEIHNNDLHYIYGSYSYSQNLDNSGADWGLINTYEFSGVANAMHISNNSIFSVHLDGYACITDSSGNREFLCSKNNTCQGPTDIFLFENTVYIANLGGGTPFVQGFVQKMNLDDGVWSTIYTHNYGSSTTSQTGPSGVIVTNDGTVYISNQGENETLVRILPQQTGWEIIELPEEITAINKLVYHNGFVYVSAHTENHYFSSIYRLLVD